MLMGIRENYEKLLISIACSVLMFPVYSRAHTTALIPKVSKDHGKTIKVIHFSPADGSNIMGIRLGAEDTRKLKGLDSIFVVHKGKVQNLDEKVVPDYYTVRGEKRETYTIPINRANSFSRAGDYVVVVKHPPHWKQQLGFYKQKITKSFINIGGLLTDWPNRVLENEPEIIPLVAPHTIHAGALFRAEAVNDRGKKIPNAKIFVEYLNYALGDNALETNPHIANEQFAQSTVFADSNGVFAFIPSRAGVWTLTLVDGDADRMVNGKKLSYDSSLSLSVYPAP